MFHIKKITIALIGSFLWYNTSSGQDIDYNVLSGDTDTLQYAYFMNRLYKQFDDRRMVVKNASRSEKSLLERRDLLRAQFREMIGLLPAKKPLNSKVTRKIDMDTYTVEALIFESQPNHHVTGLFYLPKNGKAPYPAVYIPCGHSRNGKAIEAYQKAARLFTKNGFAVLQADPISQGERYQLLDKEGKPKTSGGTLMHEFFGQALALTGSSTLEHELFDNIRGIDFLVEHPLVDKNKIAVVGNSGGGTQSTFLMAYDDRIKVATPSCFIASIEEKMRTHGIGDFCQHTWGEGKYFMEEQDFLFMAAPAPVAILSAEDDFFSIKGAKTAYQELQIQYAVLGKADQISHTVCEGPHGWHKSNREASVQWCKRWLLNDNSQVIEPLDIGFFTDEECLASSTGQVLSSFENERSMFDIIEERVSECSLNRAAFIAKSSQKEMLDKIEELIGYEEPKDKIQAKKKETINQKGVRVEKILLERDTEHAFYLPALLFINEEFNNQNAALIMIDENGKNDLVEEAIKEVKKGRVVLIVDITDTGELKDKKKFPASLSQYFTAKFPLHEGKTLLAYRTEDIVIAAKYLQQHNLVDKEKIDLFAAGNTNYSALHAAFITGYFNQVVLDTQVKSWELMATEAYVSPKQLDRLDNIVPDALNYYDLPDLEKLMSGTALKIISRTE